MNENNSAETIAIPESAPVIENKEIPISQRKWKLLKGFDWNPLVNFPRNSPCFCGSKKKFKKCCIDKIPRAIKSVTADKLKGVMEKMVAK